MELINFNTLSKEEKLERLLEGYNYKYIKSKDILWITQPLTVKELVSIKRSLKFFEVPLNDFQVN